MTDDVIEKNNEIKEAIYRRAVGYDTLETTEEYETLGEDMKLVRKKVTTKNIPPDVAAAKMVLEDDGKPLSEYTDEELEKEKIRLLKLLAEAEEEIKNGEDETEETEEDSEEENESYESEIKESESDD